MHGRLSATLLILTAGSAAPRATFAASPLRTAIVPVIVAEEAQRPTLSGVYASIAEAVRYRPSILLVLEEETFARALECGADERCVASELASAGVDLGILVVVNTEMTPALFGLKLIDGNARKTIAESVAQLEATKIVSELGPRLSELLEKNGHPLACELRLKIDPPDAFVSIDGAALVLAGVHLIPPGKHTIALSHPDYLPKSFEVETRAGVESEVASALERREQLIDSPWLWVGVAAVLAGAATALLFATRSTEHYACGPFEGVSCEPH
jgi:hypothetical protein